MIYVTGDTHGDIGRFKSKEIKKLKKNDVLIVCGDFGFVWDGSKKEQKILRWLGKRKYQVLFCEGTHDNLDLLAQRPVVDFCGGKARQVDGKCMQLLRGEIYTIESDTIFVFGGGETADVDDRTQGITWWAQELPSQEEMDYARGNLNKQGNVVDYIITHEASATICGFLNMESFHTNHLNAFLDEVAGSVRYKQWFFGRYHQDKVIPPLYRALYQQIVPLKANLK